MMNRRERLTRSSSDGIDAIDAIGQSAGMQENVFAAPSAFNFFPPDCRLDVNAADAPELAIVDATPA